MSIADQYRAQVGDAAFERQQQERAQERCDYCWAPPGQPHTAICPHAPAETAEPDSEPLF